MICWGKRLEAWRWGLDEVLVEINASVVSRFIYIILCTFPLCFPTKDQRLWFAKVCFLLSFFSSYKKFDLRFDWEIVKNYLTRLPSFSWLFWVCVSMSSICFLMLFLILAHACPLKPFLSYDSWELFCVAGFQRWWEKSGLVYFGGQVVAPNMCCMLLIPLSWLNKTSQTASFFAVDTDYWDKGDVQSFEAFVNLFYL